MYSYFEPWWKIYVGFYKVQLLEMESLKSNLKHKCIFCCKCDICSKWQTSASIHCWLWITINSVYPTNMSNGISVHTAWSSFKVCQGLCDLHLYSSYFPVLHKKKSIIVRSREHGENSIGSPTSYALSWQILIQVCLCHLLKKDIISFS